MVDIRLRHRTTADGTREYWAYILCPKCESSFSCGEWMGSMAKAVNEARNGYAEHVRKWPDCGRKDKVES